MESIAKHASITQNSFAVQYTSLILIVLAFTIGALVKPIEQTGEPVTLTPPAPVANHKSLSKDFSGEQGLKAPDIQVGLMQYQDLFSADSSTLLTGKIDALAAVLKSHDLRAEIRIFLQQSAGANSENFDETNLMTSFERSIALSRALEVRGVPSAAYRVRVLERGSAQQAEAELFRDTLEPPNG